MANREEFKLDNGNCFYIRRYDAFLSMKILGDVQKKFLGPFALFMDTVNAELPQEVRDKRTQDAIAQISMSLDGESLIDMAKKVLNPEFVSVSIDGGPPQKLDEGTLNLAIDDIYDVVALVFEVLKVNYAALFTRGRNLIGQAQSEAAIH